MKSKLSALFVLSAVLVNQSGLHAAPVIEKPLYQVTVVQSAAKAINYRNLSGAVEIDFKGTVLLPSAKGTASIRNKAGVTKIEAEFENLSTPTQFGSEYLTYIFWGISPDGKATNLGELIVKDGKGEIETQTPLQALTLLVTAEPYFAVSQPSNVVILENGIKPDNKEKIELVDAKYELLPRGGIHQEHRRHGSTGSGHGQEDAVQCLSGPKCRADCQSRRGGNVCGGWL